MVKTGYKQRIAKFWWGKLLENINLEYQKVDWRITFTES
jgi:hypothetical protein